MATFVNNITSSSTVADIAAQFATWASQLATLTVADNFTGPFSADVSNIVNALSKLGGELSGNISAADGVTIDTRDISEDGKALDDVKSTVQNDVLSKTDLVVWESSGANADNAYDAFHTANPDISTTTHDIYYSIIGFDYRALSTDSNYTLGNITARMNGSVITMSGTDREGKPIADTDMTAYYRVLAIPK